MKESESHAGFGCPCPSARRVADLDEFASTLDALARRDCMIVIDCSSFGSLSIAAARMLERVSRRTTVRLTNAAPAVRLLATVFDVTAEPPAPRHGATLRRARPGCELRRGARHGRGGVGEEQTCARHVPRRTADDHRHPWPLQRRRHRWTVDDDRTEQQQSAGRSVIGESSLLACRANADAANSASTYYFTNNGGTLYPRTWSDLTTSTPPAFELPVRRRHQRREPAGTRRSGLETHHVGGGPNPTTFACS